MESAPTRRAWHPGHEFCVSASVVLQPGLDAIPGASVSRFLEDRSLGIIGWSKADDPPWRGWASSNQLKARLAHEAVEGEVGPFSPRLPA